MAAGLAVLLAVGFHLDVTPVVVVPILIALPGLYLACAALPGGMKVLVRGRAGPGGGIRWSWACTR